jgi:very-short-patch-repair endonuclease
VATGKLREWAGDLWDLSARQHGVVSRKQLAALGMGGEAIRHGLASGRLHRLVPGVYAVGRPTVGQRGHWMAAVLASGTEAMLSHRSAATLWGMVKAAPSRAEVVVPAEARRRPQRIRAYRRAATADRLAPAEILPLIDDPGDWRPYPKALLLKTRVDGIPVTGPSVTLVDFASCSPVGQIEAAVNEADHRRLIDPETLRAVLDLLPRRPGLTKLRDLLDVATHTLTTTQLERQFLPLVRKSGLPPPTTQRHLGGARVDFYWPELGLVVETDSLRFHRTAFKQSADKRRDNRHARSGLVTLRFTHTHITYEEQYVLAELRAVARTLQRKLG